MTEKKTLLSTLHLLLVSHCRQKIMNFWTESTMIPSNATRALLENLLELANSKILGLFSTKAWRLMATVELTQALITFQTRENEIKILAKVCFE